VEHIDRIGKWSLKNCNRGCAYTIIVLAEVLDIFRLGVTATSGRMIPSGNLSFAKKNSGRMVSCELNPEGLGFLWLRACPTWGKIILAEDLHDSG
jgi:hypothetical protein